MNDHTSSAARYRLSHQSSLRDDLVRLCPYEPGLDSKVASDADGMVIWGSWDEKYQILGWSFANGQSIAHD